MNPKEHLFVFNLTILYNKIMVNVTNGFWKIKKIIGLNKESFGRSC